MASYIYLGLCFISVLLIWLYLPTFVKQHGLHYMTFLILAAEVNLNCYFLYSATTTEAALNAQKGIYAVSLFFPIIFLSILCDLCKLPRKLIQYATSTCASILVFGVATTEKTGLFYKSFELDPVTHIVTKEYGILHSCYYIYIVLGYILTFVLLYLSRHKKDISIKSIFSIFLMEVVYCLSVFIGDIVTIEFDFDGVAVVIIGIMMLLLTRRLSEYDIAMSIAARVERDNYIAIATIDKKRNVLGYNDSMARIIPDFGKCRIDRVIPDDFSQKESIEKMIAAFEETKEPVIKEVFANEKWYQIELSALVYSGGNSGYQIILRDITEKNKYITLLETYRNELLQDVEAKVTQINDMQDATLLGIAELIESRDGSTGGHIKRTSVVVKILSDYLLKNDTFAVSPMFYKILEKVAPLHDVGKVAVDDVILRKPGKFTPEEFEQMKQHAAKGGAIIGTILKGIQNDDWLKTATNVASSHHERWDGTGYPNHQSGTDIPLEARIMAVADVYDALVSKRCYKEEFDFKKAYSIIMEGMGTQFDPSLKDCFCACVPKLEAYYTEMKQEEE